MEQTELAQCRHHNMATNKHRKELVIEIKKKVKVVWKSEI